MAASDASQKYLKFIIELKFKGSVHYLLWGTDENDSDKDKFLVDYKNRILCFSQIGDLLVYMNNNIDLLFYVENTLAWMNEFHLMDKISKFDFNIIYRFIDDRIYLSECTSVDALNFIDLLNLMGDYINQLGDEKLIDLFYGEDLSLIKDYFYLNFFWSSSESEIEEICDKIKTDFNYFKYQNTLRKIVQTFENALVIVGKYSQ